MLLYCVGILRYIKGMDFFLLLKFNCLRFRVIHRDRVVTEKEKNHKKNTGFYDQYWNKGDFNLSFSGSLFKSMEG